MLLDGWHLQSLNSFQSLLVRICACPFKIKVTHGNKRLHVTFFTYVGSIKSFGQNGAGELYQSL